MEGVVTRHGERGGLGGDKVAEMVLTAAAARDTRLKAPSRARDATIARLRVRRGEEREAFGSSDTEDLGSCELRLRACGCGGGVGGGGRGEEGDGEREGVDEGRKGKGARGGRGEEGEGGEGGGGRGWG